MSVSPVTGSSSAASLQGAAERSIDGLLPSASVAATTATYTPIQVRPEASVTPRSVSELISAINGSPFTGDVVELVKALRFGESGPTQLQVLLVRSIQASNEQAVIDQQDFRKNLLAQLAIPDPAPESRDEKRQIIKEQLKAFVFKEENGGPAFAKWNDAMTLEAFNTLRTLGFHDQVVAFADAVEKYSADKGTPSPLNKEMRHLVAYAHIRIGQINEALTILPELAIDGQSGRLDSRAGELTFGAFSDAFTKLAREVRAAHDDIVAGRAGSADGMRMLSKVVATIGENDRVSLFGSANPISAESFDTRQQRELLAKAEEILLNKALITAQQGFIEYGSSYIGLNYLRRATEMELLLERKLQNPNAQMTDSEREIINFKIEKYAALRTHLPLLIDHATIAEGGTQPVLVWGRASVLETALVRGDSLEKLSRDLEKLLLAVERESTPLKANPLYKVDEVEGPGWKLKMTHNKLLTGHRLLAEQIELAQSEESRFGNLQELTKRYEINQEIIERLGDRIALFEASGQLLTPAERKALLNEHRDTATEGERYAQHFYVLREALTSGLPMEIQGSAKIVGGLVPSYVTNNMDTSVGAATLKFLMTPTDGKMSDDDFQNLVRFVRYQYRTRDLQNLTHARHEQEFDAPQAFGLWLGGAGDAEGRAGIGAPTSLFTAVRAAPGDCRMHANSVAGLADLQVITSFRKLNAAAITDLIAGDLDSFHNVAGVQIPALISSQLSQVTAEMLVGGEVNGGQFTSVLSGDRSCFMSRVDGQSLNAHDRKTGVLVSESADGELRYVPVTNATESPGEAGDRDMRVYSRSENHTFNVEISFATRNITIDGRSYAVVDRDIVAAIRTRDAFCNLELVPANPQLHQIPPYDLGNTPLELLPLANGQSDREQLVFRAGNVHVIDAQSGVVRAEPLLIRPSDYSVNPITFDPHMTPGVRIFGMRLPERSNVDDFELSSPVPEDLRIVIKEWAKMFDRDASSLRVAAP